MRQPANDCVSDDEVVGRVSREMKLSETYVVNKIPKPQIVAFSGDGKEAREVSQTDRSSTDLITLSA